MGDQPWLQTKKKGEERNVPLELELKLWFPPYETEKDSLVEGTIKDCWKLEKVKTIRSSIFDSSEVAQVIDTAIGKWNGKRIQTVFS